MLEAKLRVVRSIRARDVLILFFHRDLGKQGKLAVIIGASLGLAISILISINIGVCMSANIVFNASIVTKAICFVGGIGVLGSPKRGETKLLG